MEHKQFKDIVSSEKPQKKPRAYCSFGKLNAFGHQVDNSNGQDLTNRYVPEIGVEVDKATLVVKPVVIGKKDLYAEIQANKEYCGMHLAQVMMMQGKDISGFADDGKHSFDGTLANPDPIVALEQAQKTKKSAEDILREIGLDYGVLAGKTDKEVDAAIKQAIQAKFAPQKAVDKGDVN